MQCGAIQICPMKRVISAAEILFFALMLGCASVAWGAEAGTAPLTTLRAIRAISHAEVLKEPPVSFEATVVYNFFHEERTHDISALFVQDGNQAIYVQHVFHANDLLLGDRILIVGKVQDSFLPKIFAEKVTLIRHGALPKPAPVTFDELIQSQWDCMRIVIRGVVHSVDLVSGRLVDTTEMEVYTDGGVIDVFVDSNDTNEVKELLDAEVELTGATGGKFDGKMELTGILLHVSSLADVKILKRASANPWSLPVTPMEDILAGYHEESLTRRVRVEGTITYYDPGSLAFLQSGDRSLQIITQQELPLRVGNQAEATGFPDVHDGFLTLDNGEIQESRVLAPIAPTPVTSQQLITSKYVFNLVSIEAQVVMEVREPGQDEYVLASDGQLFSAIYRHPPKIGQTPLPAMRHIPLGSRVRVTGICILENSDPFAGDVPFNILMRSFDDIEVIANPTLLNVRNLVILIVLLLLLVAFGGVWGWRLERTVRHQNAATAEILRKRSHILEDINGSRPLPDILEKIVEMVSFTLDGAPCWCELADGSKIGEAPAASHKLRVARANIHARRGLALGALFAAFNAKTPPTDSEELSLDNGTRLAALAIETRRLYLDLRRRSEFDLLTDIHNRFSLDKRLDVLIEGSRPEVCVFGLIYIDLDKFKLINDRYGHHVGDLFLQEVALRMKRQLRGGDMLARLGGDEFAVLVSEVHNRAGVEEAKLRLERCFDEPFAVDSHLLPGAASIGIALYPEDGATRDSLLMAADAAMYAVKNRKRQDG
jgi:diguanylate cyclase (GGDEF)-like protein